MLQNNDDLYISPMSTKHEETQPSRPVVISPVTLPNLLNYLLTQKARLHCIICSSKAEFITRIFESLDENHPLLTPTLELLRASSAVSLSFCPTVQVLLAYLSTFPLLSQDDVSKPLHTIVLISPLAAHADTSANSAQGLSRLFTSAVELSIRSRSRLLIAEPISENLEPEILVEDELENDIASPQPRVRDPWNEHVPILNITSSKFRIEQRGLVGSTISARRVAERWCVFRSLDEIKREK